MSSFTQIFGGTVVYPSAQTFISLALTGNVTLNWPTEQSPGGQNIVADIIEVSASSPGLAISLPNAEQGSQGYVALFNNIGANTFSVTDNSGNTLMAVASGQAWLIYLVDNSTPNGTWRIFQFGAGVSSANAAALAGAGLKAITTTLNERYVINPQAGSYAIVNGDRASLIEHTGGAGHTFTLPNAGTVGSDWFCLVKNNGTGVVTVQPPAGTIDGVASLSFNPENSAIIICDGVNYLTVGFGQAINSIFDFVSIDVSGSGDFVLTGANLNRISYRFTGALTGARNIIVPNTTQQYWVDNETTGAFALTVKTAAGTGVAVAVGGRQILYCDSVNVVAAVTIATSNFPDGTAGAPSITFASHPTTGIFLAGADILGFATAGVQRLQADAQGHWIFAVPGNNASPAVSMQKIAGAIGLKISSAVGDTGAAPTLQLLNAAAGGFSIFSITGNNGTAGTNDFALFQNGADLTANLINRANAGVNIGANNAITTQMDATGHWGFIAGTAAAPALTSADRSTGIYWQGGTISFAVIGTNIFDFISTVGPFSTIHAPNAMKLDVPTGNSINLSVQGSIFAILGGPIVDIWSHPGRFDVVGGSGGGSSGVEIHATTAGAATGGAAALPANPQGFLQWQLNGGTIKLPFYNN